MKKIFLTVLFCLCAAAIHAAPVGNPARFSTDEHEITRFSYEGEYVIQRDLDNNNGGKVENLQGHYAKFSYIFEEPVEMYALAGITRLGYSQDNNSFFETSVGGGFGVGMKGQLWKNEGGTAFGVDGKYRSVPRISVDEAAVNGASRSLDNINYRDWQLAAGVSQEFAAGKYLYGGIKYSDVDFSRTGPFRISNSENIFGPFIGVECAATPKLKLFLEAHVFDELAVAWDVVLDF